MKSKFEGWTYTATGLGTAGHYTKGGYTVFCNGDAWVTIKPDGEKYAKTYKTLVKAIAFAESKMKF